MRKLELRLFGAFRKYSEKPVVELSIPENTTIGELRSLLPVALAGEAEKHVIAGMVRQSAIATESEILLDDRSVPSGCVLAILPPVCGG